MGFRNLLAQGFESSTLKLVRRCRNISVCILYFTKKERKNYPLIPNENKIKSRYYLEGCYVGATGGALNTLLTFLAIHFTGRFTWLFIVPLVAPKYVKSVMISSFPYEQPGQIHHTRSPSTQKPTPSVVLVDIYTFGVIMGKRRTVDIRDCEIIHDPCSPSNVLITLRGEQDPYVLNLRWALVEGQTAGQWKSNVLVKSFLVNTIEEIEERGEQYQSGAWLYSMNGMAPPNVEPTNEDVILMRRLFAFMWMKAKGLWSIPGVISEKDMEILHKLDQILK